MSWTDYSSAPAPGTSLCPEAEVTGARTMTVTTERGDFPLLLVRTDLGVKAYVNACPHQYLPLDYRGQQILSADGTRLLCTSHGAAFDAATGEGVAGEGLGCALDAVPLEVRDGQVLIAG